MKITCASCGGEISAPEFKKLPRLCPHCGKKPQVEVR